MEALDIRMGRPALVWVFTILALVSLAFGSFFAGLDWVTSGGVRDGELFAWSWPPTMVAVWAFGSAGLVTDGRLRLLAPYLLVAVCSFLAILFLHTSALTEPSVIGPLLLLALNCGAVYLAWRVLLRGRLRLLLVWLFTLLTLSSLAVVSSYTTLLLVEERAAYGVVLWQLMMPVVLALGAGAILAAGRPRMMLPYLLTSAGAFYMFILMQLALIEVADVLAVLPLIALNWVAIIFAWEGLLWEQPAADAQAGRANEGAL